MNLVMVGPRANQVRTNKQRTCLTSKDAGTVCTSDSSFRDGKHTSNTIIENEGNIYKAGVEVSLARGRRNHDIPIPKSARRRWRGEDDAERLISKSPKAISETLLFFRECRRPDDCEIGASASRALVEMVGMPRRIWDATEAQPDPMSALLLRRGRVHKGLCFFFIPLPVSSYALLFFGGHRRRVRVTVRARGKSLGMDSSHSNCRLCLQLRGFFSGLSQASQGARHTL